MDWSEMQNWSKLICEMFRILGSETCAFNSRVSAVTGKITRKVTNLKFKFN